MSEMHNVTEEEMRRARDKAHEDFVVDRALYEKQFNDWYRDFLQCTELQKMVDFDFTGWTMQNQVPELYAEYPDEQVANAQMDALEAKIRKIDEIAHSYNLKAHEKHLELLRMREADNS